MKTDSRGNPWPQTQEELSTFIKEQVDAPHDYNTCVDALWKSALAAFNYVAHELGVTGFQASCADLKFVSENRMMDGPFAIIKAEDLLYPQYDIRRKVEEYIEEWTKEWAAEAARKKIAETPDAHPNVLARWKQLAGIT